MTHGFRFAAIGLAIGAMMSAPAAQAQYRNTIAHNPAACDTGGPAIRVTVNGIKNSQGTMRVQTYRATQNDWLQSGRWLSRVETPARRGSMTFCVPVSATGSYGVAVRHDVNNNGRTDLREDGGGMSNNPSINVFNLGRPSHTRVAFTAGSGITPITINMRYF